MPADGSTFDSAAWQMWRVLESMAKPRGVCVRRVCDRAATKVCAKCGEAEYCGEECEKRCVRCRARADAIDGLIGVGHRDWKDHNQPHYF